jgi:hypothetical protein
MAYIYIRSNEYWNTYNVFKLGKTNNILDRESTYITSEIIRGYYVMIIEVDINILDILEKQLQEYFNSLNLHVIFNAGIEFYEKEIINYIIPFLDDNNINYKLLNKEDIKRIIKNNWNKRDYQIQIIDYSYNILLTEFKIYIELATGGGKTVIVYNLFELLKSKFIIIISPRKIINSQNISNKYLEILSNNYDTFNYSCDTNINDFINTDSNKIIISCTQSINKLYDIIIKYDIKNILIWFDEAHWCIENKNDFWLLDNEHIKYRIFTSASPNEMNVLENTNLFGHLYKPIKIRKLIELKWLSSLDVYIYSENKKEVNSIKYVLDEFNEKNRKYGFSFHNKKQNAFNLFYKHYNYYIDNKTTSKPFLLISEFKTDIEIKLNYNYLDIKTFENTINSIGYVVAKYNIGYDFEKLDFIYFSDPKLSIQDIKQSIGRGLRSDTLGYNGTNKDKKLIILLPVYVDNEEENKYNKIIEVVKYFINDIEIKFEDIKFINKDTKLNNKNISENNYNGYENIKSILLNLLENKLSYNEAKIIIKSNNIKTKHDYYLLCESDIRLPKEPEILFKDIFINWLDYLNIEKIYYNLDECKNKIKEYFIKYPELKKYNFELLFITTKLCEYDNLFPPYDLWSEYYHIKDLQDIIIFTNKKKKLNLKNIK